MVVADPDTTLLTACENGYGKRTTFGYSTLTDETSDGEDESAEEETSGSTRYRTQRRGGMGLRDIKTTKRNGKVIGITRVQDDDEVLMMTAGGKIQRTSASEISVIGRNTSGVRIMGLSEGDTLAAIVRVPKEDADDEGEGGELAPDEPNAETPASPILDTAEDDSAATEATLPEGDEEEGDNAEQDGQTASED